MRTHVVLAKNYKRISRHRLDAAWCGDELGRQAQEHGDWLFEVYFGFNLGEAPTSGRRPDMVECCLVVSSPLGLSVAVLSACSGGVTSKATAANLCVLDDGIQTGAIWSGGAKRAKEAAERLREFHAEHWNEMETLGAMACD